MRLRFDGATGRACPARPACTAAQDAPRQRTVRLPAPHAASQAARPRQDTTELKAPDALRAGGASRLAHGIRRFDLRQSRDLGVARPPPNSGSLPPR
jgi:hypothetical protein